MNKQKDQMFQSQRITFSAIQAVVSSFMGSKENINELLIQEREPTQAEKYLSELLETLKEGNEKASGVDDKGFVVDEWWKTT